MPVSTVRRIPEKFKTPALVGDLKDRLYSRISPEPNTGCWLWTGLAYKDGYGVISVNNQMLRSHRVIYELLHGPIPEGLFVCHRCDVRACINPDHLFLGTSKQNTYDAIRKGRRANCGRSRTPGQHIKLSIPVVEEIRANPHISVRSWAERLGVSTRAILAAKKGLTWKKKI